MKKEKIKNTKIKVLQVYALTGLGHLREAISVENALKDVGIEAQTLDILEWSEKYSWFTRLSVLPLKFFKWFFEVTTRNTSAFNAFQPPAFVRRLMVNLIRNFEVPLGFALRRYLAASDADVFIAVHPWGLGAIWSFGLGKNLCQSLINIIPDEIDPGSAAFYAIPGGKSGPLHLVNSQWVADLIISVGVDPERVKVVGHTLDPLIYHNREQIFARIQYHLKCAKTITLGALVGGTGTNDEKMRIKRMVIELADAIKQERYRLKILPGPHIAFALELNELRQSLGITSSQVEIFADVDRNKVIAKGHEWMKEDIDVLFAKTGETIFYSMACGLPHINLPPKGANEVKHMEFMKSFNAMYEFDAIVNLDEFLSNRSELIDLSSNAYNIKYQLDGAIDTAKLILGGGPVKQR